jgi:hypothetical protein
MEISHSSVIHPNKVLVATDGSEDTTLALLQIAEEVAPHKTLLAVGCRGLGAVGRARLGSVSTNALRAARGPVLIYSKHVPVTPDGVP